MTKRQMEASVSVPVLQECSGVPGLDFSRERNGRNSKAVEDSRTPKPGGDSGAPPGAEAEIEDLRFHKGIPNRQTAEDPPSPRLRRTGDDENEDEHDLNKQPTNTHI